jgi:hypothetical protein
MKNLILILFATMLACSPLMAENTTGKTAAAHSQIGKAKHKKHHKNKAKKKAKRNAKKNKAAAARAEAA